VRVPNRKLTAKEIKEYNILANQHFGEFDIEVLDLEFKEVDFDGIGIDLKAIEFEASDVFEKSKVKYEIEKERKAQVIEAKEDDFDTTPPAQPFTVLGDLYEIGEHRLLCGDSTDSDQVAKLMNGEKADCVITDPPYNIAYKSGTWSDERKKSMKEIANDNMDDVSFIQFLSDVFILLKLFTKDKDKYIFTDWKVFHLFKLALEQAEYKIKNLIIWNKMYQTQALNKFANAHEFIIFLGDNKFPYLDINVWDCKREFNPDHPTPKPVELVSKSINYSTCIGDICLDLFTGSGPTMVASHQLQRKCYGMELDPSYCDVIVKRMHKLDPSLRIIRNGIDITDTIDSL
jgi:site-specific DNA-methyltransferase (adenine-specific)